MFDIYAERKFKGEFEVPPHFELPSSVIEPVVEANQRIMERLHASKRPSVVLVLERSAVLPASSAALALEQKRIPVVAVPVGKVLPLMFAEKNHIDEEDINLNATDQAKRFIDWLRSTRDPTIRALRIKLIQNLDADSRILVLDDAQATGETIKLTLPLLIKSITHKMPNLSSEVFYSANFGWEKAIVEAAEDTLSPAEKKVMAEVMKGGLDIRRIKLELESGWYDLEKTARHEFLKIIDALYKNGHAIVPAGVKGILPLIGLQAMQAVRNLGRTQYASTQSYEADTTTNPAQSLLTRFGYMGISQMRENVTQQFLRLPVG